jgi:hypothetical protein
MSSGSKAAKDAPASGQGSLKSTHKDLETGFDVLVDFAIDLPEQVRYWKQLSQRNYRIFYSRKEINIKIKKLNQYYTSALVIIGYLYQSPSDEHLQKITALLNTFFVGTEYVAGLESMKLLTKLNMLPVLIRRIKIEYFKPSYLRRNWVSILLVSTIGSWAMIKVFKRRELIYLAIKEFRKAGSQLIKVWIWEPMIRIYETIRYKDSKLRVMGAESLSSDLDSLERMVLSFAKDSGVENPSDLQLIGSRALQGDLKFVLESYEQDLRHPIYSISTGALIRPLLIQIQKAKVDAALALSALDTLLRSNELNFAFLAVLPILGILGLGISWARGRLIYWSGTGKASLKVLMQKSLRSIEKEFNRNPHSSSHMHPESYGNVLVDLTLLKRTGAKLFKRIDYEAFLSDLEQLESCFTDKWTVAQGLESV